MPASNSWWQQQVRTPEQEEPSKIQDEGGATVTDWGLKGKILSYTIFMCFINDLLVWFILVLIAPSSPEQVGRWVTRTPSQQAVVFQNGYKDAFKLIFQIWDRCLSYRETVLWAAWKRAPLSWQLSGCTDVSQNERWEVSSASRTGEVTFRFRRRFLDSVPALHVCLKVETFSC